MCTRYSARLFKSIIHLLLNTEIGSIVISISQMRKQKLGVKQLIASDTSHKQQSQSIHILICLPPKPALFTCSPNLNVSFHTIAGEKKKLMWEETLIIQQLQKRNINISGNILQSFLAHNFPTYYSYTLMGYVNNVSLTLFNLMQAFSQIKKKIMYELYSTQLIQYTMFYRYLPQPWTVRLFPNFQLCK